MRLWKKYLSLFILLLGSGLLLFAQEYDYIQYTTKDGLPTNYVYGVVEDDEGYIWAYTENGMAKFDGYTFKHFSTKDGLPGNDIPLAIKDKWGRIWLDIYKGKPATYIYQDSVYVPVDYSCSRMSITDGLISYKNGLTGGTWTEFTMQGNHKSNLFHLDSSFLEEFREFYEFKIDSVKHLKDTTSYNTSYYFSISNDSIYYYRYLKLFRLYLGNHRFAYAKDDKCFIKKGRNDFKITYLPYEISREMHRLSAYKFNGLDKYLFLLKDNDVVLYDFEQNMLNRVDITIDLGSRSKVDVTVLDNSFILSTSQGLLEYDFDGNLIDQLLSRTLAKQYYLLRSFKDSKDNIWIGSREGGLFLIPSQKRKSQLISLRNSEDKVFEQIVKSDYDKLLSFTDNSGIYTIENDSLHNIVSPDKQRRFKSASYIPPYGILMSSSDNNWILTKKHHFISIDEKFSIKVKDWNNKFKNSLDIQYDQENQILYGGDNYNYYFNKITSDGHFQTKNFKIQVKALHLDKSQENIYIGNDDGIFVWKKDKMVSILDNMPTLLKNVSSLYGTPTHLWIGTESNGLFTYNYKNSNIHQVSDASYIRRIRPHTDSTLLIASNEGILVVDSTQELQRFTLEDGLFSNEIQDVYYGGKRYIYVANSEGLLKLDRSATFEVVLYPKDLRITDILVNQQSIPIDTTLDLAYKENDLEIKYHLMSFASNQQIKYSTKLEPLESSWRINDDRETFYLNLNPGQYTFHLKAEDIYGNEVSLSPITINIRPAYWQTLWFKFGIALLLMGLSVAYLFFWKRQQKRQIKQEKETHRKIADLELSALKAQMNPHFVFNALGAIQYYIQTNDANAADNYLTHFAQLIRKYLNSSREKVITLREEIELLNIYTTLEKMRFESLFEIEIKTEEGLTIEDISLPSMLIQPFVENAINHGLNERRDGNGFLSIHFYTEEEILYCVVQDNGIGRTNAQKKKRKGHRSRGMAIIEDKVATLKNSGIADVHIQIQDVKTLEKYPGTEIKIAIRNLEEE